MFERPANATVQNLPSHVAPFHATGGTPGPGANASGPGPGRGGESSGRKPRGSGASPPPFEWDSRPVSIFLYGTSRPLVNLSLFALARSANPEFLWIDIHVPGETPHPTDPVHLGWVPDTRVVELDPLEPLNSNAATTPSAIASLIRPDGPEPNFARISEFLRLPEPSQRILSDPPADGRPGVIAVTNAHRLMSAYDRSRVSPILSMHLSAGYSLFVGFADAPGEGRTHFDYVFRLDGETVRDWRASSLTCEKGDAQGVLRVGHTVRLPRLGFLADVFERALPDLDD